MKVDSKIGTIFIVGVVLLILRLNGCMNGGEKPDPTPEITRPPVSIESPPTDLPLPGPSRPDPPQIKTPPPCDPQYPPNQGGWVSSYEASSTISLEELYIQKYGNIPRDNLDLYAVIYYNNRKALEEKTFDAIDPIGLGIKKGENLFLPPLTWINQYREFPIPILKAIHEDNVDPKINISGTSILYPLSSQISRCFEESTNPYQIDIEPASNTKLGLSEFCQGRADMFGASEEITQEMLIESGCTGVEFLKFEVAIDAITLFMNKDSSYAKDTAGNPLTKEELKRLMFSANTWSEVRSNWDDKPINRYFPHQESGAFEAVKNELFPNFNVNSEIPNLVVTEDDNQLISKVIGDNYSVGFSNFENYLLNIDNLRAISIENISPNLDTIKADDSGYPLTRKLYLYTGTTTYNEKPLLRYFINYYLAYEFDFIDEFGYFRPNNYDLLSNPNTIP